MLDMFRYLKPALAPVLAVVGIKMLTATWLEDILGAHFNFYVLGIVLGILTVGVVGSLWAARHTSPGHVRQGGVCRSHFVLDGGRN